MPSCNDKHRPGVGLDAILDLQNIVDRHNAAPIDMVNIWWITPSWHALILPTDVGFSPLHHHSALGLGSQPLINHQKIHFLMVFARQIMISTMERLQGKERPFICHLLWLMAFAMTQNWYQNVQSRSLAFHPKWTELCKMKAVQSFRFGSFDTQNW